MTFKHHWEHKEMKKKNISITNNNNNNLLNISERKCEPEERAETISYFGENKENLKYAGILFVSRPRLSKQYKKNPVSSVI